jgi:hypothetical protein
MLSVTTFEGTMEKQAAPELLQEILKMTSQLNVIAGKVEQSTSGDELQMMRRHIAQMMAACDEHLFRPILRQFPDLEPHPYPSI